MQPTPNPLPKSESGFTQFKQFLKNFASSKKFVTVGLVVMTLAVIATPLVLKQKTVSRSNAADTNSLYVSPSGSDQNFGTSDKPFLTISKAAVYALPGTTIHVAPGTYNENVVINTSGTATNRIIFVSDTKDAAKIRSTAREAVTINGSYVDFQGFDVSGTGDVGIFLVGSNVKAIGNTVHDVPASGCTNLGGAGIGEGDYSSHDKDIIGNIVYNIGTGNCSQVQGIYHSVSGGHIYNNIVYNNSGWGIHLWHAPQNVFVANNLVFNNHSGGIVVGAGDAPGGVIANHITVENNIVLDNIWYGIAEVGSLVDNTNSYTNNIVFRNQLGPFRLVKGLQSNNLLLDPLFVNYQINGSGDYHLTSNSPARGAGISNGAPTTDIDNATRTTMDIGPYIFPPLSMSSSCSGGTSLVTFSWLPIPNVSTYTVDFWGTINGKYNEYQVRYVKGTSIILPNAQYPISQVLPKDSTATPITLTRGFPQELKIGAAIAASSGNYSNSVYFTTAKCLAPTPTPSPTPTPPMTATSSCNNNKLAQVTFSWLPISGATSYTVDWWGTINGKYNEYQVSGIRNTSITLPNTVYPISQQLPRDNTATAITTTSGFPQNLKMGVSYRQQTPTSSAYSHSIYFTTVTCQ